MRISEELELLAKRKWLHRCRERWDARACCSLCGTCSILLWVDLVKEK